MHLLLYQIDAFAGRVFAGNPAAVVPLDSWLPDELMQAIAAENNLAETAFFVREGEGYGLRWFTPTVEVDLCGHATLAAAHVLFARLGALGDVVHFQTRSGALRVHRRGNLLALDFPARPPAAVPPPAGLIEALGQRPAEVLAARDYFCVFAGEADVRALAPDMGALSRLDRFAVIVTAPGDECDFVSRFFAPAQGIPEDPATGSSHCTLIPYWSRHLGKRRLAARQLSARGGEFLCEDHGERVTIAGRAVLYLEGKIAI